MQVSAEGLKYSFKGIKLSCFKRETTKLLGIHAAT